MNHIEGLFKGFIAIYKNQILFQLQNGEEQNVSVSNTNFGFEFSSYICKWHFTRVGKTPTVFTGIAIIEG